MIGICGRKGHGKTTAASILSEDHDLRPVAFSDAVKRVVRDVFPHLTDAQLSGGEKEVVDSKIGAPPRWVMQRVGTEAGRGGDLSALTSVGVSEERLREAFDCCGVVLGETMWIDALFRDLSDYANFVVHDVRFPNEAEAIRKHGGVIFKVVRPDLCSTDEHPSETSVDRIDPEYLIHNPPGDLERLRALVGAAARHVLGRS